MLFLHFKKKKSLVFFPIRLTFYFLAWSINSNLNSVNQNQSGEFKFEFILNAEKWTLPKSELQCITTSNIPCFLSKLKFWMELVISSYLKIHFKCALWKYVWKKSMWKNSPPQYLVPMGAPNNYHKAHMGQLYAIGLVWYSKVFVRT